MPTLRVSVILYIRNYRAFSNYTAMQAKIHPNYFVNSTTTCACGAVLKAGSVKETLTTEICSNCHPFYTGKKKFVDTTGRVDRFRKLAERAGAKKDTHAATVAAKAERSAAAEEVELGAEAVEA